jgi:hypothetical protein
MSTGLKPERPLMEMENNFKNLLKQNSIFDKHVQTKRLLLRNKYENMILNKVFTPEINHSLKLA